jgi:hypothetical protein
MVPKDRPSDGKITPDLNVQSVFYATIFKYFHSFVR